MTHANREARIPSQVDSEGKSAYNATARPNVHLAICNKVREGSSRWALRSSSFSSIVWALPDAF